MVKAENGKCLTCGKKAHNFEKEEPFECVPPKDVLKFGQIEINKDYREALYNQFPFYNTEEVVGTFFGYNPHFPSQSTWLEEQNEQNDEDED